MPVLLDNNQQDYISLMNRALNLQARSPGQLDSKLQIGLTMDDWTRPEFSFLRKQFLYAAFVAVPPVAAQFSEVQFICNSPPSVIVLEGMILFNQGLGNISVRYGWGGFDGGVTVTPEARDSRNYGGASVAYLTRQNTAGPAAPTPNMGKVYIPLSGVVSVPLQVVITNPTETFATSPCFKVITDQVNVDLGVSFFWRERALLPSEIPL